MSQDETVREINESFNKEKTVESLDYLIKEVILKDLKYELDKIQKKQIQILLEKCIDVDY